VVFAAEGKPAEKQQFPPCIQWENLRVFDNIHPADFPVKPLFPGD
jgi:hypothetical protein